MPKENLENAGLAAGWVTETLSTDETERAERLLAKDPEFAALVALYRERLEQGGGGEIPDVWNAVKLRLTGSDP